METIAPQEIDYRAFGLALDQFASDYDVYKTQMSEGKATALDSLDLQKKRSQSIIDTARLLSGTTVQAVTSTEQNELIVDALVKKCRVIITLSPDMTLSSISIASPEFSWVNTQSILEQSRRQASPTDLRHAMVLIGCAQDSKSLFQKHTAEFRKQCIVQYYPPLRAKLTFRNGMTVAIQANEAYGQIAGCLQVTEIQHVSMTVSDEDVENIRLAANKLNCTDLLELFTFLDQYKDL